MRAWKFVLEGVRGRTSTVSFVCYDPTPVTWESSHLNRFRFGSAGNQAFLAMAAPWKPHYKESEPFEKKVTVKCLLDEVTEKGYRFAKKVDGVWTEEKDKHKIRAKVRSTLGEKKTSKAQAAFIAAKLAREEKERAFAQLARDEEERALLRRFGAQTY